MDNPTIRTLRPIPRKSLEYAPSYVRKAFGYKSGEASFSVASSILPSEFAEVSSSSVSSISSDFSSIYSSRASTSETEESKISSSSSSITYGRGNTICISG